ncbi:hypothetical protein [Streptomyces roseoverticillatus]|uniref:Uncharacterized protein n=1 Tax=Streptomyces roseoverticillatus TaxID=66429 RepID=A0ABV3J601_9ACTN
MQSLAAIAAEQTILGSVYEENGRFLMRILAVAAVLVAIGFISKHLPKEAREQAGKGLGAVLGWALRLAGRVVAGREITGRRASTAGAFRSGHYPDAVQFSAATRRHQAAVLAAEAAYGPDADWEGLRGRVREWRDRAADAVLRGRQAPAWARHAGRIAGVAGMRLGAVLRAVGATLQGVQLGVTSWGRWPYAARAAARLWVAAIAWLLWQGDSRAWWVLAGGVVAGLAVAATGPMAAGWWHPRPINDRERYAFGLFGGVAPVLRLDTVGDEERPPVRMRDVLEFPEDLAADGAVITLLLPMEWQGTELQREQLAYAIERRIPGEWDANYQLYGDQHWVQWTRRPAPEADPVLPGLVSWIPSDNPRRVMVGQTHQGPYYVDMGSATPHWGVSGGTGDGKTTGLLIPVVHARMHGALVDCITLKTNAFEDIEGESGIRVHKSGRTAVAAIAEFFVSMKAAEAARGTTSERHLRPRYLVIDEFGSFVLAAKLWWKYGIGGKGVVPFEAWFHMILMQGRSSDHRIIVGAHTFSREMFGSSEVRDLVGTKAIMGPYSDSKWLVTFGYAEKIEYDFSVKGRGAIGITGQPDIEEIQFAYITPEARGYLKKCEDAPEWFDRGEMAPWITADVLAEAEREVAVAAFLPGGEYMVDDNDDAHAGTPHNPRSEVSSGAGVTPGVTLEKDGQDHGQEQGQAPAGAAAPAPEAPPVYSLSEACARGILPIKYGTARNKKSKAQKAGLYFPEGVTAAGVTYYTEQELREWWEADQGASRTA